MLTDVVANIATGKKFANTIYWSVHSGGIFRKGYLNKKETVAKTEPQQPNNAVSSDSSLSVDEHSGTSSTDPNGKSTVSGDKGSDSSLEKQRDSENSPLSDAENGEMER